MLSNTHQHDFLTSTQLSPEVVLQLLGRSESIRADLKAGRPTHLLAGKSAALVFQKPSLRTRVTFDLGINQLGGHGIYLSPNEINMGVREPVHDIAKNLERWVDLIVARVFGHHIVSELAEYSRVPVINALSDTEHPCQAMADFLALRDHGRLQKGLVVAYVGDGNNICHSLLGIGSALEGVHMRVAAPKGYEPLPTIVSACQQRARQMGGSVTVLNDPRQAVRGAHAVYTDVWASMGQEEEARKRALDFARYQVTTELMAEADPDALFMHDLPAHRGEEVAAEVIDGPRSIIFDQAENRLHAQKAIMAYCVGV
jgi:ornithine carbamoyltransferase